MGCCGSSASKSKQTFIDTALENDAAFRKLLATCGADRKDVVKMFDAFAKIDKQGNGTVDKAEFFEFYGKGAGPTISSEMYDGLFLVLDDDKTQCKFKAWLYEPLRKRIPKKTLERVVEDAGGGGRARSGRG